jgi:predicted RNA-binding protein with TRAM domain
VRDATKVALKDRVAVNQAVAEDNRDRKAVYREIAVANGHPEWEGQIRDTFAKQWIASALPAGGTRTARPGSRSKGGNGAQQSRGAGAARIRISIDGLGHDGRGVGRVEGKAVFVAGALPGERVRARQTGRNRHFDEAETIEVLEASPQRVTPRCPHFGVCSGCVLQHLDQDAQIAAKQNVLLEKPRAHRPRRGASACCRR